MLKHLYISQYALIDELELALEDGFSVITGETGAGKSIIMGALALVMGARADSKSVREGAAKCVVEASFSMHNAQCTMHNAQLLTPSALIADARAVRPYKQGDNNQQTTDDKLHKTDTNQQTVDKNNNDYENDIEKIVREIEHRRIDITNDYHNWMLVAMALAGTCGATGEQYFHRISQFHPKYDNAEAHRMYQSCVRNTYGAVGIGTIVYLMNR